MRIEGQFALAAAASLQTAVAPAREPGLPAVGPFPKVAPADGGYALAALVGNHYGKPGVQRPRPERRLAQPRVSEQGYPPAIHRGIFFQVIHGAAGRPGPCGDGAPLVRRRLVLAPLAVGRPCWRGRIVIL